MDNEECFVETPQSKNGKAYFICRACPHSRDMKSESLRKHRVSKNHTENYNFWLAEKQAKQRAEEQAKQQAEQQAAVLLHPPNIDPVVLDLDPGAGQNNMEAEAEPACLVDLEFDPDGLASERRRRTLIDLWTKDHTEMFRTPSHSVNSNEDRPIDRHPDYHSDFSDPEDATSENFRDQSQREEDMDVEPMK